MLTTDAGVPPAADRSDTERDLSKVTGGHYGQLPNSLVLGREHQLSATALYLMAYRSLHVGRWGCCHRAMRTTVRSGLSRGVFQNAIREAVATGCFHRRQGRQKRPGADTRGQGRAVDWLTFDDLDTGFVVFDRGLFNGTLTPVQIAIMLYLRARGTLCALPWQLMKRFGLSRPTISALLRGRRTNASKPIIGLVEHGLVKNYGTSSQPLWGLAAIKNPTLKKAARKKAALKNPAHLRTTFPSRNISPPQDQLASDAGASPHVAERGNELTDAGGDKAQGRPCPADLPFSRSVLAAVAALGIDLWALISRYEKFSTRAIANGRAIADPSAYLLKMAHDVYAKRCGVSVEDVREATSSYEWKRRAASARMRDARPKLSPEKERSLIADQLRRSGLDPIKVEAAWRQAAPGGNARDYQLFALQTLQRVDWKGCDKLSQILRS